MASLAELDKHNLIEAGFVPTRAPQRVVSRREAMSLLSAAGMSMALLPFIIPVTAHAVEPWTTTTTTEEWTTTTTTTTEWTPDDRPAPAQEGGGCSTTGQSGGGAGALALLAIAALLRPDTNDDE